MGKGIGLEELKEIEIKLEELKIQKTIADRIKKLIISEKYFYHISRHKIYCAYHNT